MKAFKEKRNQERGRVKLAFPRETRDESREVEEELIWSGEMSHKGGLTCATLHANTYAAFKLFFLLRRQMALSVRLYNKLTSVL